MANEEGESWEVTGPLQPRQRAQTDGQGACLATREQRMRGRILLIMVIAATVVACTRKQSLYIEPGKADSPAEQTVRR